MVDIGRGVHRNGNHWDAAGPVGFPWEWDGNGNECDGNGISVFTMILPSRETAFCPRAAVSSNTMICVKCELNVSYASLQVF